MRRRQVETAIWYDDKFVECTWLEKYIFIHLQLRRELMTCGVIVSHPAEIAGLCSGECSKNEITPRQPVISEAETVAALEGLKRREMVEFEAGMVWSIWLRNFLKHQTWSPTVVRSWPEQMRNIPHKRIRDLVRDACRAYCAEKGYEIPEGS